MHHLVRPLPRVGQQAVVLPSAPPDPNANADGQPIYVSFEPGEFAKAFRQVTPTLLVVGIFTGLAFAVGGALADRYVTPRIRGRRA